MAMFSPHIFSCPHLQAWRAPHLAQSGQSSCPLCSPWWHRGSGHPWKEWPVQGEVLQGRPVYTAESLIKDEHDFQPDSVIGMCFTAGLVSVSAEYAEGIKKIFPWWLSFSLFFFSFFLCGHKSKKKKEMGNMWENLFSDWFLIFEKSKGKDSAFTGLLDEEKLLKSRKVQDGDDPFWRRRFLCLHCRHPGSPKFLHQFLH